MQSADAKLPDAFANRIRLFAKNDTGGNLFGYRPRLPAYVKAQSLALSYPSGLITV
jgi:hypothetical protein